MPREPTVFDIRSNNIITCSKLAVSLLNDIHDAYGTPFVQAIANTTLSILDTIQNVKRNKEECVRLMENIHAVIGAIVNLHITSQAIGGLPPATLHQVGKFTETLHKMHTFVEAQQYGGKIKSFFRQSEVNALLKSCQAGLQQAMQFFQVGSNGLSSSSINDQQRKMHDMQTELLKLISDLPLESTVSDGTSVYLRLHGSQNSSTSFSLLPARPKIFHGRESELQDIVNVLMGDSPRISILGGGGMGKTSLARAALHHPDIAVKYQHRFFVAADSSTTSVELAEQIGLHIGLKLGKDLTPQIVRYFSANPPSLLILDNLETPWEPLKTRGAVEELLSALTDVSHLALMITMRGAEHPAKVRWSRPFLPMLGPLPPDAARRTFADIAEESHDPTDIDKLLGLTDNMPLAVDLIAHLVDYEGCGSVLSRWETEKTSLLSSTDDRRSSLDASIAISLASPRIIAAPGARDLLSLLSILPDGISDFQLAECLTIQDVGRSKSALLSTALAYLDEKQCLRSLAPIRENIHNRNPPSFALVAPLGRLFHFLLDLYRQHDDVQLRQIMADIESNRGNIRQVLMSGLHRGNPNLAQTIYSTIFFNSFNRDTGHGHFGLMEQISAVLPVPRDYRVETHFITELLKSYLDSPIDDLETLLTQGISNFRVYHDPSLESTFYHAAAKHYIYNKNNIYLGLQFLEKAIALAKSCENPQKESSPLISLSLVQYRLGDYTSSQMNARKARRLAKLSGSLREEANALRAEAWCCGARGDYKNNILLTRTARHLVSLCGMSGGFLDHQLMAAEAEAHTAKTEYADARSIYNEILRESSARGDINMRGYALLNLVEIDLMTGTESYRIRSNLEQAKTIFTGLGSVAEEIFCDICSAALNLREGDYPSAKVMLQDCLNLSRETVIQGVTICLELLADPGRWDAVDLDWRSSWAVLYLAHTHKAQEKLGCLVIIYVVPLSNWKRVC
ncbi:hypothetical protein C8R43DRAFT_1110272 [Mycena crocata]|nr:hypothetical protein C8R43DRAFT_1110272 [Mycena crocata]